MNDVTRWALALILLAGAAGCSSKKTNISGTITRDGNPLVWESEGGHLLVLFVAENRRAAKSVFRAETDREAGTFTIGEIPAGKYRVAIQQFDEKHNDALGHAYNPGATELEYEVRSDGQVIDIDLPKDLPKAASPGGGKR